MRSIVVTGASRGLGLGMARQLAVSGYQVIAVARRDSEALREAMREAVETSAGAISFVPFDLGETAGIPGLVKALRGKFGPIYGLVNNAGIGTGGVLANMADPAIENLIALNVLSPIMLTKYVVRSMMTAGEGRVVNVSSVVASNGYNGLSVYSASKAALLGFTRSLAREVGPLGITVNAIAPGFIETEMTAELNPGQREQIARRSALKRMAEIQDIADAVEYLISDKAKNITGTTLTIDAGNTA